MEQINGRLISKPQIDHVCDGQIEVEVDIKIRASGGILVNLLSEAGIGDKIEIAVAEICMKTKYGSQEMSVYWGGEGSPYQI